MRPGLVAKRQLEVYLAPYELTRPCLEPCGTADSKCSWNNACQHDVDLRARVSDGSTIPKDKWDRVLWPAMKESVRRVMNCWHFSSKEQVRTAHYKDIYADWSMKPTPPVPGTDLGEVQIMGWDYMVDESYRLWLIEANAYATLKHNPKVSTDVENKTQLAKDIYSLLIGPIIYGDEPDPGRLCRIELS